MDTDGKDEATLRDFVAEEVLVPTVEAPPTGWRVDRFPQGPGRMRLVSAPLWSLKPPTCEPELWLIIGKAAQSEMRAKWQADDPDAFAAQEERRSSWRRAKRGCVVACEDVAGRERATWIEFRWRWTRLFTRVPLQFEQFMMTPLYRVMVVSWLSVLAAVMPALRVSYSKLEHYS